LWFFLLPYATGEESVQNSFFSNGDFISGWYWLRDQNFEQKAEWIFFDCQQ
jgi:hypothetical protein